MVSKSNGCSFGHVSRNMVDNLSEDFKGFRKEIREEFKELKETNAKLFNHLSSRVPPWVTIIMTIGASLITGVIVWGLSK